MAGAGPPGRKFSSFNYTITRASRHGTRRGAMDNLLPWALCMITATVGLRPGLVFLSARPIARFIHRALRPRQEVEQKPELSCGTRDLESSLIGAPPDLYDLLISAEGGRR